MRVSLVFTATCLLAGSSSLAWGQDYPSRPIRIIVPAVSGGSNDVLARVIGEKLRERYGQPVFAENRPGASQMLGSELTAKAAPDGYTLMLPTATFASSVATRPVSSRSKIVISAGCSVTGVPPRRRTAWSTVPDKSSSKGSPN